MRGLSHEDLRSAEGHPHKVKIYLDCTSHIAVNRPEQQVTWSRHRVGNLEVLRMGSTEQKILGRAGDDLRIDWGCLYLAVPSDSQKVETLGTPLLALCDDLLPPPWQ